MIAFKVIVIIGFVLSALYAFAGTEENQKNGRWMAAICGVLFIAAEIVSRIFG